MIAVAYGGGVYIAVGNGGVVSRSTDGVNWSQVAPSPTPNSLTMVKYLNGKFWAVGVSGTVMSSADGLTWNVGVYPDVSATNTIIDIDYKDGKYAVGDSNGKVYFSTTGATGSWGSGTTLATVQINYLANLNGTWFAIDANGEVHKSADGTTWIPFTLSKQVFGATYGNGTYVIYSQSGGSVFTSTDASTWTEASLPSGASWYGLTYGNGAYILVGNNGYIMRSTDGTNWTPVDPNVNQAIYNNGLYIAVGYHNATSGIIMSSTDGMTWINRLTASSVLISVAYGNNLYAAVGTGGKIYTSADGIGWTAVKTTNTSNNLTGIRYVNGKFMAVGVNGTLLVSNDGTTWTAPGSTGLTGNLTSIAYGNGKYLISGNASSLWYSSDGATWEKTTAGSTGAIAYNDVIYAGNQFIAAGSVGNIYSSPDGVNWTQRNVGTNIFYSLAYENGMYVAVGTLGTIYSSRDGVAWTAETSNVSSTLRSALYDGSRFYAIGAYLGITTAAYGATSSAELQTAEADGAAGTTTSTKIDLTFDTDVAGLTDADITITNGTGSAVKGALTGSGKNWSIALGSVTTEGDVSVAVASPSGYTIGGSPKTVAVYKASAGGGSGSTFTVVNTNDSGTGSLRWAIVQAGAVADGKVVFDPALAGQTITLESDLTDWDVLSAKSTIIGDDSTNFTLTGLTDADGKPAITVDGNGHRGLWATGSGTFSLSDIRLTGFELTDSTGVYNGLGSALTIAGQNYETAYISNVQFDHNRMTSENNTSIVALGLNYSPFQFHLNRVVLAENELTALRSDINTYQAAFLVSIYSEDSEIANSLFYNNRVNSHTNGDAYGGVIGGSDSYHVKVLNNTFYGNRTTNTGAGQAVGPVGFALQTGATSVDFYNNIMIGNQAQDQTATALEDAFYNAGAPIQVGNNLYTGNPFINVASGDFRLSSPATEAIDLGDDSKSFGSFDLAGKARKVGSAVDIGAYEYVPGPVSDDASLTSVLGQTDAAPGGGNGSYGDPITWSIDVPNNVTKLVTADILPADSSATIWFYEDSDYAGNDGFGIASLDLPEGGSATAYIQIDSGSATQYYAVTVNRAAAAAPAYTINGTSQPWQDATLAADGDVLEITTDDSPASPTRIYVTASAGSTVTLKGKAGKIYDKVYVLVDQPITLKLENFNIAAPAGDTYNGIGFVKHNSPGEIVLEAAGSNTIEGFNGIFSDSNHQLTIKGTGTLTAKGRTAADPASDSGSGIYMTSDNTSGNTNPVASLTVDGSVTVKAYGGDSVGASGGSGIALNWGNLLIKSGDVEAYGGKTNGDRTNLTASSGVTRRGGAGVYLEEFGSQGQAGKLTVEGGSLKAVGGDALAENVRGDFYEGGRGIRAYQSVFVSGGTVQGTGGASASQKGGDGIFTPKLDISGAAAAVTGNGGTSMTGIEAGAGLYVTNDIVIDGSTVSAAGGQGKASEYGIYSPSGSLTIKGGADVTASGGSGSAVGASGGPAVYVQGNIVVTGSSQIKATGGNGEVNGSHGLFSYTGQITINDNAAVTAIGGNGTTGFGGVGMRAFGNGTGSTVEIASDAGDVYVRGGQGASATRPAVIAKDVWIASGNVGPIAMEGTGNPRSIKNQSGGDDVYLVTVTTNPAAATSVFSQVDGTLAGNYTYKAPTLTDGLAYMWLPSGTQTVGAAGYQNKTPNVATDDTASTELTPLPVIAHLKHGSATTDFTSIQAALDASADGDTVTIEAGTYRDQLTVAKNITLQGAGIGQTIIESPNSDELVAANWKTLKNQILYPVIGVKTSTNGVVVIKDLTIDGRKQGYIAAHNGDADVYTFNGIAVRDTSATIDQVKVIDVRDVYSDYSGSPVAPLPDGYLPQDQPSGANHNESILLEGAADTGAHKVTVQDSEIVRFHKTGILAWGPALEVDIHVNKLQGHGKTLYSTGNGIQIASSDWSVNGGGDRRGTTGIVKDNEIYDFGLVIPEPGETGSYLNLGLGGPTGILLYQAGDGFVIEGNTITGPSVPSWHNSTTSNDGGYSNDGIGFTASKDLTIRNNTITGFGTGIVEGGAATGSTIEDNTFSVNEIDIWTLSGDDTIKLRAGTETVAYNRTDNGIDTIEGFGAGDRLNVIGFEDGSVNGEIGTSANAIYFTETGGSSVINGYSDAHPVVDFTGGTVTSGDGTNVAAHSVEVSVSGGVTTLYIDTEGDDDAAEFVIKLAGVYAPGNFKLNGGYISYVTLVPADGLTVMSSDPAGVENDGKTKIDATPTPATGHKLVYYNFGAG
ncbi:choice-of-anchor Q domain-containing protein, partial [Cohnella sp. GbtcB17]|uniref:choice-of-anchor Q domain-containing protein n=1 Tax=Cohnella sp. GbtcB17 TaxID=2824762 RepID=UPI001C30DAB7